MRGFPDGGSRMIIWPSSKESEEIMPKIRFDEETLGLIVRNRQGLRVPINQRSYAWRPSHVEDLFTDLNGAITKGASEYFLGSIIVVNPPDEANLIEVYDGQQRLATTMILIAAIRDFFVLSLKNQQEATTITGESLLSIARRGKESSHFTLSAVDNNFFVARVLREPNSPERLAARPDPKKESHELIEAAAVAAAAHVKVITKNLPADVQASTLHKWLDFLETGARVIWVEVQDQATAYRIFETMNDRGLKLSAADLIKNYLYSLLDEKQADQSDQITLRWQSMSAVLESLGREDGDVVDYLRYFWITTHGQTRSGDLFDNVKSEVNSAATALSWAETLQKRADDYAAILTPTHDAWSTYHQEIRAQLDTLRYLGVSQIRPLLLSALGKFSEKELARLIKNAVNWSVRCLVAGVPSGNLEGSYSRTAKAISDGAITDVDELSRQLVALIPTDERFEGVFRTITVPTASLARYYLRKLQIVEDGKDEPQYTPNDGQAVTLEHILPQKPGTDWTLPQDKMRELYNRLGNQALLAGSVNSSIGNVGLNAKRQALADSPFTLTSQASSATDWGEKEIGERQVALAKLAIKAWPFLV